MRWRYAHLGELGCGSSSNLLGAELAELSLELTELLGEILLVLGPEGTGLDFSGRLLRYTLAILFSFLQQPYVSHLRRASWQYQGGVPL